MSATDLTALGIRADNTLADMVALQLGNGSVCVALADAEVSEIAYDLPAMTTASRHRVSGTAVQDGTSRRFSFFVKVVQTCERSPVWAYIPPEFHPIIREQLQWRAEPMAYASELAAVLPPGLRMPRCYGVISLDDDSAALWLEDVDLDRRPWTHDRYRSAATLLGRFAAGPAVADALAPITALPHRGVRDYVHGRVANQLVPALRSAELWQHPLVAEHFGRLRSRLNTLIDRLPALTDELERIPVGTCHGDACTRNLLWSRLDEALCVIDFGFLTRSALGVDLSQLVLAEIQLAERGWEDLAELDCLTLAAYYEGLVAEGSRATEAEVGRGRAIGMGIFSAMGAVPLESLGEPESPDLHRLFAARSHAAEFVLELLEIR